MQCLSPQEQNELLAAKFPAYVQPDRLPDFSDETVSFLKARGDMLNRSQAMYGDSGWARGLMAESAASDWTGRTIFDERPLADSGEVAPVEAVAQAVKTQVAGIPALGALGDSLPDNLAELASLDGLTLEEQVVVRGLLDSGVDLPLGQLRLLAKKALEVALGALQAKPTPSPVAGVGAEIGLRLAQLKLRGVSIQTGGAVGRVMHFDDRLAGLEV